MSTAAERQNKRLIALLRRKLEGGKIYYSSDRNGLNLSNLDLRELKLRKEFFRCMSLAGVDFSRADLRGADFSKSSLMNARLQRADLRGADFTGTYLRSADFRRANLRRAVFVHVEDLYGGDFRWADLRWADFTGTYLAGVDLRWADLRGAIVTAEQLAHAKGIEQTHYPKNSQLLSDALKLRQTPP